MYVIISALAIMLLINSCATLDVSGAGSPQAQVMAAAQGDETMYVACQKLPLHERASGYASTLQVLAFGEHLTVVDVTDFYQINLNEKQAKEEQQLPTWAKVNYAGQQGFVAARCLVTQDMLAGQSLEAARKRMNATSAGEAGRGFSEYEEGDLVAMQGAKGKAVGGKANYKVLDSAFAERQVANPQQAYSRFRQLGQLGQ